MLFDAVKRFVALAGQVGVKGSDPEVKELMVILRRGGFSSSKISELSDGKWSDTLVRQYTVNWGGVDDSLDLQRNSMTAALRRLASSGRSVEDVEHVLGMDASVMSKGSSLAEVAELNSRLRALDLRRGEIGRLVALSRELEEQGLNPFMVRAWITLDQELVEEGLTRSARELLLKATKSFGGVDKALEVIDANYSLAQILREHMRIESMVNSLRDTKEGLDAEISEKREMIDRANAAIIAGFNYASLSMVAAVAKNLGGPYKVVTAIQKYESLEEMDKELEAKKAELKKTERERTNSSQYLAALSYTLEEAKKEYQQSSDVRLVVELLNNPRGIRMDRVEVAKLLSRVLDSAAQRIEGSSLILSMPSPAMGTAIESIKALARQLRLISDAGAQGP